MTMHVRPFGTPDLAGKTVLVRAGIEALGDASPRTAARALAATIGDLTRRRARVIVLSGRGDRATGAFDPELSLRRFAIALSRSLEKVVTFIPGRVGGASAQAIAMVAEGGVGLLENLDFTHGENSNDRDFAQELAGLGDYHINALGGECPPRASTHAIAEFLPSLAIRH